MRLLITGICGFVGSTLAQCFLEMIEGIEILGIDNLIRPGSEMNRRLLPEIGCKIIYGDVQNSDLRPFDVPWIVMNAALAKIRWGWQPSVRLEEILKEIADHAERNPEWLQVCDG